MTKTRLQQSPGWTRRAALAAAGASALSGMVGCAAPKPEGPQAAAWTGTREYVISGAYVLTMDPIAGDIPDGQIHVRDDRSLLCRRPVDQRGCRESMPPE